MTGSGGVEAAGGVDVRVEESGYGQGCGESVLGKTAISDLTAFAIILVIFMCRVASAISAFCPVRDPVGGPECGG
ncbi:hypothetical protein [Streptomyces sp. CoH27]|uniref:hypothetical protein n=1 Tax=Streptomyces sp. CoH27 TaxID=2875763 RepID=UPI001CD31974|nr:hypothetical protein [Streptomyces sp. CoH27]